MLGTWDRARAGFWDTALAGHSALRAAAWRALGDETMAWLGGSTATVWLDVAKFFDSLDPERLISKLVDLQFPPFVLYMQLLLHWSPRIIASASCDSEVLTVTRSVLAGSEASCSMARGYVYDICERISSCCPRARLSTFVDDMVIRAEGPRHVVVEQCAHAVAMCATELRDALLEVADDKSVCVGSSVAIARDVVARLQIVGLAVRASRAHKDLGVDAGGGRVRRSAVQASRFRSSVVRTQRLAVLTGKLKTKTGSTCRWATRLWKQAVLPAMSYGHELLGWAPSRLLHVRRLAADASGFHYKGRCLTTSIAVGLGGDQDPAVTMPKNIIFHWISLMHQPGFSFLRVERAWAACVAWMGSNSGCRWRRATGPMSTCIAVLLDAKWTPQSAGRWLDRTGGLWGFDPEMIVSRLSCAPLLDAIGSDIECDLWQAASLHRDGAAVAPGCATLVRQRVLQLIKKGDTREAGVLRAASVAGLWTPLRKFEAGLLSSPVCLLCGHHSAAEFHQCWECPSILSHPSMIELDDHALTQVGCRLGKHDRTRWTRCLHKDPALDVPQPPLHAPVLSVPELPWPPSVYFTDASGGEFSSTIPLRRVGFAAIQLAEPFCTQGLLAATPQRWLAGPLSGRQTVNRGETAAGVALLVKISPAPGQWTTVVTDSAYFLRGSRLPRTALLAGPNGDIWLEWHAEVERHGEHVVVRKVKAHSTLIDVAAGVLSLHDYWGNVIADLMAGQAASFHQLPHAAVTSYQQACATSLRIMKHVARAHCVALDLLSHCPDSRVCVPRGSPGSTKLRVVSRAGNRVVFSNGHSAVPSGVGWKCEACRLYRKKVDTRVWTPPCVAWAQIARWQDPAPVPPSKPLMHALDVDDFDFDLGVQDQVGYASAVHSHAALHAEFFSLDDSGGDAPSLRVQPQVGPVAAVEPVPAVENPGFRTELRLAHSGCFVHVGGSRVHRTHSLRFTAQYVWCQSCGGFTTGRHAKILHGTCRADAFARRYVLDRLARGLRPQPGQPFLDDGSRGRIVVVLDDEGSVFSATQVPD